jgi:hypothetical protein
MGWMIAGIGVAGLVAVGLAVRLLVLILAESTLDRGDTEDDPVDWGGESSDEPWAATRRHLTPATPCARR